MKEMLKRLLSEEVLHSFKVKTYRLLGKNKIKVASSNTLVLGNTFINNCSIRIRGHNNRVVFAGGGNILNNCKIEVFGNSCQIVIGESNLFVDSIFWLEDNNSKIIIGDNNKLCGKVHMGIVEGTTLEIKNKCLFSSDIYITTTDSHSILDKSSGQRINQSQNVMINNHVWVGHKVIILKGVNITDNVIIGSGALVSKSVEEQNVIVAGNPAKIIKHNVDWDIQRL